MEPIPDEANLRTWDAIARADGTPITTGTVNFYLVALTGGAAGKWWKGSTSAWQITESIAGVMTHRSDGHWYVSIAGAAWNGNVEYMEYGMESGNLHVPYSTQTRCRALSTAQTGDSFARLGTPAGASIAADVAAAKSDTAAILVDTGTDGVVVAAASKTGYALSATGLDAIADPDDLMTGTVPSTFTQKLRWLIQRLWKANKTPTAITVKNEAGTTITTQTITDNGAGTETLGGPS